MNTEKISEIFRSISSMLVVIFAGTFHRKKAIERRQKVQ